MCISAVYVLPEERRAKRNLRQRKTGDMIINMCFNMHPMGKARPRVHRGHASLPPNYRRWKDEAAIRLRSLFSSDTITANIKVTAVFYTKTGNCKSDLDNAHASCLDALQDARVIANDRQVKSGAYEIRKSEDGRDLIIVTTEEI